MGGIIRSYGPAPWLDYYDTHAIMCAWYYTSCCIQQTWNQTAKWTSLHTPKYALKYAPDCTRLYTPSLLDLHSQDAPKYSSKYVLKYTPGHALKDAPNCTRWHTPSLLDIRSQAHSKYAPKYTSKYVLKYTPGHALKDAPNCTRWHTPSLLGSTLPNTLLRGKTLLISLDYMLTCTLLHVRSRGLLSCRHQAPEGVSCRRLVPWGVRLVEYGG